MEGPLTIPFRLADLETVPQPLRIFFTKGADGSYTLNLESHPAVQALEAAEAKVAEFRTHNRGLNSLKQELESKLKALEADAAAANQSQARAAEVEAALQAERGEHAKTKLSIGIVSAFRALGGLPAAEDFVVAKGLEVFRPGKNGEPTTSEYSPTNPSAPLSINEWLTAQIGAMPFAFAPSRGGGATHSQVGPAATAKKVISADPMEFGKHLEAIAKGEVVVR